jgi:hypothetical protein
MSLIETLIALTVLAIGLTAAASAVIYSSLSLARTAHVEEASMLAQSLASALASVPYTAQLGGGVSPFADVNAGNNNDIADSAGAFCSVGLSIGSATSAIVSCTGSAAVPSGTAAPDHTDSELTGTQLAQIVIALPTGRTPFERYWNIRPTTAGAGTNGVTYAVIVRWKEGSAYYRTVVVGTRFQP